MEHWQKIVLAYIFAGLCLYVAVYGSWGNRVSLLAILLLTVVLQHQSNKLERQNLLREARAIRPRESHIDNLAGAAMVYMELNRDR